MIKFYPLLSGMRTILGATLLVLVGHVERAHAVTRAGEIMLVKGEVFIVDAKANTVADTMGKRPRQIKVGAEFFEGETINTKAGARVKLKFDEGQNEVVLGSDTSLLIERAGGGAKPKGTSLNLAKGEVRSDVKIKYSGQGAEVYEVKSKNAVAGVRGTIFTAIVAKNGNFTVATQRGEVSVQSTLKVGSAPVPVKAGTFSIASPDGASTPKSISSNPDLARTIEKLSPSEKSSPNDKEDSQGDSKSKSDRAERRDDGGSSKESPLNNENDNSNKKESADRRESGPKEDRAERREISDSGEQGGAPKEAPSIQDSFASSPVPLGQERVDTGSNVGNGPMRGGENNFGAGGNPSGPGSGGTARGADPGRDPASDGPKPPMGEAVLMLPGGDNYAGGGGFGGGGPDQFYKPPNAVGGFTPGPDFSHIYDGVGAAQRQINDDRTAAQATGHVTVIIK